MGSAVVIMGGPVVKLELSVTCGCQWFRQKYRMLGNFPSAWFGGKLPIAPSFHLDARDVIHRITGQEDLSIEEFYRSQVLFESSVYPELLEKHMRCGVLFRTTQHAHIILQCRAIEPSSIEVLRAVATAVYRQPQVLANSSDQMDGSTTVQVSEEPQPTHPAPDPSGSIGTITAIGEFDRAWIIAAAARQFLSHP